MLFEKNMEPRCAYCARGSQLDDDTILCVKRGLVSPGHSCRKFQYDPFKRVPPKPVLPDFSGWDEDDFSL